MSEADYHSRYDWEDDEAQDWLQSQAAAQEAQEAYATEEIDYKERSIQALLDSFAEVRAFLPLKEALRMLLNE